LWFILKEEALAMKRTAIRGLVLVTTALAFPLWALAAGDSLSTMPVRLLSYAEADLTFYHFGYQEDVPPPFKSTESGLLTGLGVTLVRLEKGPSLFARLAGVYTGTSTHYDGTTQSGYPATGETKNKFLNAEGNVGLTFPAPSATSLTVYAGLGYRYWERGLGGWEPYRERYTWKYVPAGVRWDSPSKARWGWGVDFAARFMYGGKIRVYFSEIYATLNDLDLTLGNRPGWKLQAPVRYRFLT
jgi:hypothetical protein